MPSVKVSSRFQIVMPKHIRSKLGLTSGQRLEVLGKGGLIILVPEVALTSMKGTISGMTRSGLRETLDRL